jgi:hypothetical protein
MVVLKPWFRLAVICLALLLAFLALYLPPFWTTSPPGFLPIVRVSGVDLTQAWAAKRRARAAAAAGQHSDAFYWWQAALGNNAADLVALRGSLRARLAGEPNAPRDVPGFLRQATWLLRLGGTNQADLAQIASAYARYRLDDQLLSLLGSVRGQLTPALEESYLTTLFHAGRLDDFAREWRQAGARLEQQPELALYYAAYLAGWGDPAQRAVGNERLAAAQNDPQLRLAASRLQLAVNAQRGDATAYGAALAQLRTSRSDTLLDHVGYWRLLAAAGRWAEAQELAQSFSRAPANPHEAVKLAEVFATLKQPARARAVLDQSADEFHGTTEPWIAHGDLLVAGQGWDELLALALKMRRQAGVQDRLTAFSYYLEGRAELGQNRTDLAARAFAKAAQFPFDDPTLGLRAATNLATLGFAAPARDILLSLEAALSEKPAFWSALLQAAADLKDLQLALRAGPRALSDRADAASRQCYASALVGSRERPVEALTVTRGLMSEANPAPGARLLHVLALLLNHQLAEAEAVLSAVRADELNAADAARYHLAWFAVHAAGQRSELALQASARIDPRHLWPAQIEWLTQQQAQLPPRSAAGKS